MKKKKSKQTDISMDALMSALSSLLMSDGLTITTTTTTTTTTTIRKAGNKHDKRRLR